MNNLGYLQTLLQIGKTSIFPQTLLDFDRKSIRHVFDRNNDFVD